MRKLKIVSTLPQGLPGSSRWIQLSVSVLEEVRGWGYSLFYFTTFATTKIKYLLLFSIQLLVSTRVNVGIVFSCSNPTKCLLF